MFLGFLLFFSPLAIGSTNPPSSLSVCSFAPLNDELKVGERKEESLCVCVCVCVREHLIIGLCQSILAEQMIITSIKIVRQMCLLLQTGRSPAKVKNFQIN